VSASPAGARHGTPAAGNGAGKGPSKHSHEFTVAVLGLGYVGLPLAVEFGKKFRTLGLDASAEKVAACTEFSDPSSELAEAEIKAAHRLQFSTELARLSEADFIVVAVPTPVDGARRPDFTPLERASETVGRHLKRGAVVVFESTVYPGATREVCIPLLEKHSGLSWKKDFFVGYSPERINPGDKQRSLTQITKVVAGDTPATLGVVAEMYGSIIGAGICKARSIEVAEAAKVIENTQRDLNIALMNELAIIFHKLGLDTQEVLDVAASKWNFLPFRPGLVGGHCIGVDPYYLTHKAESVGYHPQVILAGRRINDGMAPWVAQQTMKLLASRPEPEPATSIHTLHSRPRVIVLGLSFKENCADLRNSKVAELVAELREYGCEVSVHDPLARAAEAQKEYGLTLHDWEALPAQADAIVAAVAHRAFLERPVAQLLSHLRPGGVFVDVKSAFDAAALRKAGVALWRL
jgi:UDP-N-acetyl-D-galactosamine dehydrogenase